MALRGGTARAASRRAAQSGAQASSAKGPLMTRAARSARAEWPQRDPSHHRLAPDGYQLLFNDGCFQSAAFAIAKAIGEEQLL